MVQRGWGGAAGSQVRGGSQIVARFRDPRVLEGVYGTKRSAQNHRNRNNIVIDYLPCEHV